MENQEIKSSKKRITIAFIIVSVVLGALLILAVIGFFLNSSKMRNYGTSLEQVYQKNYYELVDNVNNAEIKLSKLLATGDGGYQKKIVSEISSNVSSAQSNLASLPLSISSTSSSVEFINQFYGYMTSINSYLEQNNNISEAQMEKLNEIYKTVKIMKANLDSFTKKLNSGYSILATSEITSEDFNDFSLDFKEIKTNEVEYPSMIYDGPFSESVVNPTVSGLNYQDVNKEDALKNLEAVFEDKNISEINFETETIGKIPTYDFSFLSNGKQMYAQMTKKGGKVLAISSFGDDKTNNYSLTHAEQVATELIEKIVDEKMEIVWSDVVANDAYFNFAPVIDRVIYYPDLIKVKVDLATGEVSAVEASSYWINHKTRDVGEATLDAVQARNKLSSVYVVQTQKLALCPLEYNREVLCYELKCIKDGVIYYFYYNAKSGIEENILKVVETDNGNLLM